MTFYSAHLYTFHLKKILFPHSFLLIFLPMYPIRVPVFSYFPHALNFPDNLDIYLPSMAPNYVPLASPNVKT